MLASLLFKGLQSNTKHDNEKNVILHLEDNALYHSAKKTKLILEKKFDLSSIKTTTEMDNFFDKNHEIIEETLLKSVISQMDVDLSKDKDPFSIIETFFQKVESGEKQSLAELKTNGEKAIKNAEDLASRLSTNSVLKSMDSFRQAHLSNPNKTVTYKYGN